MKVFYIYVEGKSDLLFIRQFLESHMDFKFEVDLKKLKAKFIIPGELHITLQTMTTKEGEGGIDSKKLGDLMHQIKTVNSILGIESIILLDADTSEHKNPKGGFESRKEFLTKLKDGLSFHFFIIPNHADDGNLESILDKIVCSKGTPFYNCLDNYVSSLLSLDKEFRPQYVIDNPKLEKEKINWYVYMMEGKRSPSKSALENPDLWNFSSNALDPLKLFFSNIFKND